MGSGWGQAVRALIAIEASTAWLETRLGRRQAEATMVTVMEATGRGSLVAAGAFKTLQRRGERLGKNFIILPTAVKLIPGLKELWEEGGR